MALKQVILARRIAEKRDALKAMRDKQAEQAEKRAAYKVRESELEAAINEIDDNTEEAVKAEVDAAVAEFEAETAAFEAEAAQTEADVAAAEAEIDGMQAELDAMNQRMEHPGQTAEKTEEEVPAAEEERRSERKENRPMKTRAFNHMNAKERDALFARQDVKDFAQRVRTFVSEKRAISGGDLLIPQVMLPMLREIVEARSKLIRYVNLQQVRGTGSQVIMGSIPEAVWTDMCGKINEINLDFANAEVNGWKVAAFIALCNALIEDNDVNLTDNVIFALGVAMARALDKAIAYGTGTRMPLGIVTRLAQTARPADYPATARPWQDLHISNVKTITAANSTGIKLYQGIIDAYSNADDSYGDDQEFFVMNKKTHMKLLSEALNFNANGALVAGLDRSMPVIGGDIVRLKDMPDNVIIAGSGECYLLAEREGTSIETSKHVRFLEDQTVFCGKARYDGKPVIPEAFVAIGINGATVDPTAVTFAEDTANAEG